jgi:predicted AAA+ superfamily ATPase
MYQRFAAAQVRRALADTPIVAVNGPRQSGKTTLVKGFRAENRPYITFDDATQRAAARSDPTGFVRGLDRAIIDEVQRVPQIVLALKQSVDEDRRAGRFLLTGSAEIRAIPKARESLAGRMEVVPLLPLAQSEILGRRTPRFIDACFAGMVRQSDAAAVGKDVPDILPRVLGGAYPEVLKRKSMQRKRDWFKSYIGALEQRDIAEIATLHKARRVPRLVEILARHAGQLVNFSQIGREVALDSETADYYAGLLENLYILRRVRPWFRNELNRLVKTPKIQFLDSGLLSALLRLSPDRVHRDRTPLGPVLETFVFSEIVKAAAWSKHQPEIYHYRDKDQVEVDFVLENEARDVVGIEVKAAASVSAADFKGLKRLAEHTGTGFRLGVVLYDGAGVVPFGSKLYAMPYRVLWAG